MCPRVGRLPGGRGKERRERTGAGVSRQGLPNEACSSHRARRSLTGSFFATRSPPFIYPQAWDGQTRWEPDNLNRNNGKGEQDLSSGSPPRLRSLTHIYKYARTDEGKARAECLWRQLDPLLLRRSSHVIRRRNVRNLTFVVTVVKRNTGGVFIQWRVFIKRQNWRGRMRTCTRCSSCARAPLCS